MISHCNQLMTFTWRSISAPTPNISAIGRVTPTHRVNELYVATHNIYISISLYIHRIPFI